MQNRRQLDPGERAALARLRTGEPEPYLAHAASSGRLNIEEDATAAKHRLLEDWWQAAERDLAGTVMLAYRRDDAHELNEAASVLMLRAGRLGPVALTLGEHEFRVGDRVLCRRNDPRLALRNGMRGCVVGVDPPAETLTLRPQAGVRSVPFGYASEHLDHAYALTGHAAQGATVERAFVLLRDEGALREWGYVACTRARSETRSTSPAMRSSLTTTGARSMNAIRRDASPERSSDRPPRSLSNRRSRDSLPPRGPRLEPAPPLLARERELDRDLGLDL